MDATTRFAPRFLYVAACYDGGESSAYCLLVTSDEEHDPESDEGAAATIRLRAQASERRDWYASDEAFRGGARDLHVEPVRPRDDRGDHRRLDADDDRRCRLVPGR